MRYKYAFYCSGSASRVIKFYEKYKLSDYPVQFIYYDGFRDTTTELLKTKFDNVITPDLQLFYSRKGKLLSEYISSQLLELLAENEVDFLFCFGDKILKPLLIERYKNKIINFHPSILPAFPGLNAIDQALKTSVQLLGNTAHFVDEGIDTGMIILQTAISRSAFSGYDSVLDLQIPMLQRIWKWLEDDKITISDNLVNIDEAEKNTMLSS